MLRHEGKTEDAVQVYRAALPRQSEAAAELLRARLAAAEGRDEVAVAAFRRAIALAPRETKGYYGLFEALGRLSRYEEQLAILARLRELDPNDVLAYRAAYTPCARLSRFDLARPLLERAVALDPHDPAGVKCLFQVRMNLRLLDGETEALAQRLVQMAPHLVDGWEQLAWIYAELGRDEESLAVLHQFLAEHPENAQLHAALAWRYMYLRDEPLMIRHACRAYALAPQDNHVCWTMLMACKSPLVPEAEASGAVEVILTRCPEDAFLMHSVSDVYSARGCEEKALEYAERARALSPASLELQIYLAGLFLRYRHWEAAATLYEELTQTCGRSCELLSAWARALHGLKDPRVEALLAEAAPLAQSPGDFLALGDTYVACGQVDAAIAAFRP
jgi:tetratricopeptide (TPR) repeat protein